MAMAGEGLSAAMGRVVRQRRQQAGLRQADLAARVGVSGSAISLLERGLSDYRLEMLAHLARHLGSTPDGLVREAIVEYDLA